MKRKNTIYKIALMSLVIWFSYSTFEAMGPNMETFPIHVLTTSMLGVLYIVLGTAIYHLIKQN